MSERAVAMNNMVIDHQGTQMPILPSWQLKPAKLLFAWLDFSAVTSWQPLRLAISPTGLDKGSLTAAHFLEIDGASNVILGRRTAIDRNNVAYCNRRLYECGRSFACTCGVRCFRICMRRGAVLQLKDTKC